MGDWLKKVARMISQKGGIFMFLRAQLSAQMATIADFLVTILLVRLFDVYYVYATLAGAIYGGIYATHLACISEIFSLFLKW